MGILGGILIIALSTLFKENIVIIEPIGTAVGFVMFVVGCAFYAQAKGYSNTVGGLLGITAIGLLILLLLKDKNKDS